jgi:thiol-disulfide isomerase/thioredoxin
MFRQLSGDLLYYLSTRSGEGVKEGLKYLLDKSVYGQPAVWDSQDDSLKIVGFADIMNDLLSKAEPGTSVQGIKVHGELVFKGKEKAGKYNLGKLRGDRNIILFYTEGCNVCKAEKAEILKLLMQDRRAKALFVNVDEILASDPSLADTLFNSFDLSSLPYIILTDRKGVVLRRYLSYR